MQSMKKVLIDNIGKIHTTEMGIGRIKRNLGLGDIDVVEWCRERILDKNASSYTIITAHKEKK